MLGMNIYNVQYVYRYNVRDEYNITYNVQYMCIGTYNVRDEYI